MKTYSSFSEWHKAQPAPQRKIIAKLRQLVTDIAPKLVETSKWGNGVWLKGDLPIIYLHTKPDHVQFGFFAGASFPDPKMLLQGKGKFVRHIRLISVDDIDEAELATMIRRAVRAPAYK